MELIIGGRAQGKRAYAQSLSRGIIFDKLQDTIYEAMKAGEDPRALVETLVQEHPDGIFLCDEIGCGLVPVDAFEREYRDTVGKICCELAQKATKVHRVISGIGVQIKP